MGYFLSWSDYETYLQMVCARWKMNWPAQPFQGKISTLGRFFVCTLKAKEKHVCKYWDQDYSYSNVVFCQRRIDPFIFLDPNKWNGIEIVEIYLFLVCTFFVFHQWSHYQTYLQIEAGCWEINLAKRIFTIVAKSKTGSEKWKLTNYLSTNLYGSLSFCEWRGP